MGVWRGQRDELERVGNMSWPEVRFVAARDEVEPSLVLLAQTVRLCDVAGVSVARVTRYLVEEAVVKTNPGVASLIRATSAVIPSTRELLDLVRGLQAALYSEPEVDIDATSQRSTQAVSNDPNASRQRISSTL